MCSFTFLPSAPPAVSDGKSWFRRYGGRSVALLRAETTTTCLCGLFYSFFPLPPPPANLNSFPSLGNPRNPSPMDRGKSFFSFSHPMTPGSRHLYVLPSLFRSSRLLSSLPPPFFSPFPFKGVTPSVLTKDTAPSQFPKAGKSTPQARPPC